MFKVEMRFKSVTILVLTFLLTSISFAQSSEEEKLRMDFVKNLSKKRNKNSDKKDKPILKNDAKQITTAAQTDEETITVETRLVRLDVLVSDEKGNTVLGLKPEDFIITENKIVQEIGTFSVGSSAAVPRTIVLIMDYSSSQLPYIKTSITAAKVLVDKLNPQDRMAIVTDDVELLVDFTNDKKELKDGLDILNRKAEKKKVGKSLQYSSLYVTVKEMFNNEDIRPIIIFQTDGDQLFRIRPSAASPLDFSLPWITSFTDTEMISTIEKSRVTIYSVISEFSLLGLSAEERIKKATPFLEKQLPEDVSKAPENISGYLQTISRHQTAMFNVAKMSGGFSENLERPEQANAIYENILKDIANRYLIGYYPTNQERDGTRRNVKIEVKGHPEYVILGRKFYFAPQENKLTQ